MAFDPDQLGVLSYCNGFTIWHYRSAQDDGTAIDGAGYFNAAADRMRPADLIVCNDRAARVFLRQVATHDGETVATAATA